MLGLQRSAPAAVSQRLRPAPPEARRIVAGGRGLGDTVGPGSRGREAWRSSDCPGRENARRQARSGGEYGLAGWMRDRAAAARVPIPQPRAPLSASKPFRARRPLTPSPRPWCRGGASAGDAAGGIGSWKERLGPMAGAEMEPLAAAADPSRPAQPWQVPAGRGRGRARASPSVFSTCCSVGRCSLSLAEPDFLTAAEDPSP